MSKGAVVSEPRSTNPESPAPKSILIVLLGSLGDVARGLSLVAPLRRAYPSARITWLVEPACADLVRCHKNLDEVLVFHRPKKLLGLMQLWRELRSRRFDVALDLQRHLKSGFFTFLSRASRRIGFHPSDAKEGNAFFSNEHIPARGEEVSKLEHYQTFLDHLGVDRGSVVDFGLLPLAAGGFSDSCKALGLPYVALIIGSRWSSKDWVLEGYVELAKRILAEGTHAVVLVGSEAQRAQAAAIHASLGMDPRVLDITGRTTLVELMHVLHDAAASIGPDSGPGHLAAALGKRYVTLFGPTRPSRVVPYGSEMLYVQSMIGCAPCGRRVCPGLGKLCMRLLSVDAVKQKLDEALRLSK